MTVDTITSDTQQLLAELAGRELEPAIIFHTLRLQTGFDPYAPAPGLFDPWQLPECEPMPASTVKELIAEITGCEYETWMSSDVAKMLDFLNSQNTREMQIIDGGLVTSGT